MTKAIGITSSLAAATTLVLLMGGWQLWPTAGNTPSPVYAQQAADAEAAQEELLLGAERLSQAFRAAAKTLRPSVVTITATIERDFGELGISEMRGRIPDELLEELQRRSERSRGGNEAAPRRKIQTGVGSGVVVSEDGYVLTNNHVVENADELKVELSDGRAFNAQVVGTDDKSDVAVLKIDATGLYAAKLGDSASMEVGDWVIAVGSPFGLDQTVTAGIISATNRQTGILTGGYEDFLQTDAAINPGNSGGPLVNLRGEIIGINTAINSRTGTNAGVGFAIPANMAARIMEDLRTDGRVVRGFIGAQLDEVTADNSAALQLPPGVIRGALIARVLDEGPAARGSLQPGDVVTSLNDRPIVSYEQLRTQIALTRPGTTLKFDVYRNGEQQTLEVVVGEMTSEKMSRLSGQVEVESYGIVVESMSPLWAERMEMSKDVRGAVIVKMSSGKGVALGLEPGDIIMEINGDRVSSAEDASTLLGKVDQRLRMLIRRGDLTAIVTSP